MRRPVLKWCGAAVLGSFIVHCSKRRTLSMLEMGGGSSNQYLLSIIIIGSSTCSTANFVGLCRFIPLRFGLRDHILFDWAIYLLGAPLGALLAVCRIL